MGYLDTIVQLQEAKQEPVPVKREWLTAWRELAQVTYGVTDIDPRLRNVLAGLDRCDAAFARDDWAAFQLAAQEVKKIVARRQEWDSGGKRL